MFSDLADTTSIIPEKFERPVQKDARVDLLGMTKLLIDHLTPLLCQAVFEKFRGTERERKWTFHAVVQFWVAMVIHHPSAISMGLDQTRKGRGRDKLWPRVMATPQAFFKKCQGLRPGLFKCLFESFIEDLWPKAPLAYASWMNSIRRHFPQVYLVDGSQLDVIASRLKILRNNPARILPGSLSVYYDLFRGFARKVIFDPDATSSEFSRAIQNLDWMDKGTLLVGDRLYASVRLFHQMAQRQIYGVFRLFESLKIKRLQVLSQRQSGRGFLEDVLVLVGSGHTAPQQRLRLIRYRCGRGRRDILTNVLDPHKLSAEQIVALYGLRWSIERLFFDLKEILDLHFLYASHPNLVAQQVYATVMVHAAFRVAQAKIAAQAKVCPEQISPAKLFPRLALATHDYCVGQWFVIETRALNPGIKIQTPDFRRMPTAYTRLRSILAQHRNPIRKRRRRIDPSKLQWASFARVKGGPTLLKNASVG